MGLRSVGDAHCPPHISPDLGEGGSTKIRVGCFNVRGIKTNTNYTCKLLSELDVCAISEHWLHNYDLHQLQSLHKDFNAFSTCSPTEEDTITCTPRFIRGSGGVSILWRRSLD